MINYTAVIYLILCKKLVSHRHTFSRVAAQPKAPVVTQFLDHASNAEASPKYAEWLCGAISKAERNCSTPWCCVFCMKLNLRMHRF